MTNGNSSGNASCDRAVLEQWHYFRTGRPVDRSVVRGIIYDSWLRCREARQDPERLELERLSLEEFDDIQKRDRQLVSVAQPVLEALTPAGNFGRLYLCSREGVGLYSTYAQEAGKRPRFLRGGSGQGEKSILDGAASMCLRLRQEVEISGPEHWHVALHGSHCMASPIFDKHQHLVGVLSMYAGRDVFHPSIKSMMRLAVELITDRLQLHEQLAMQDALLAGVEGGAILLDADGGILDLNATAREWLGLRSQGQGRNIGDFLASPQPCLTEMKKRFPFRQRDMTLTRNRPETGERRFTASFYPAGESGGLLLLRAAHSAGESEALQVGVRAAFTFDDIAGSSAGREHAVRLAERMAGADAPVLLLGESGTGKELFAQAMHNASARRAKPFVVVNCGALPRELVQAELFGYEEGAFTGARKKGNMGKFELADGGTIFLDEIGDMPLDAQASLLRLTQNGEVLRLGGRRAVSVNARVIAATNKDLPALMAAGLFREDLYFRLSALTLRIPPLRERKEDIRELAKRFLAGMAAANPKAARHTFSEGALSALEGYAWPGNIRQLKNVVEQACCLAAGAVIRAEDLLLPATPATPKPYSGSEAAPPAAPLPERRVLEEALQRSGGNVKKAAALLRVSRYTLYNKMKACGLTPADFRKLRLHCG